MGDIQSTEAQAVGRSVSQATKHQRQHKRAGTATYGGPPGDRMAGLTSVGTVKAQLLAVNIHNIGSRLPNKTRNGRCLSDQSDGAEVAAQGRNSVQGQFGE